MGLCFSDPRTDRLASFVRDIGIAIEAATLPDATFFQALKFALASSGSTQQGCFILATFA